MTIRTRISHCSAPSARFERARYGLEGRCSIQLSYEGKHGQATGEEVSQMQSPIPGSGGEENQGPKSLIFAASGPVDPVVAQLS